MASDLVNLLKTIRDRSGLSQKALAGCMGIGEDTYRHVEKGKRPIPGSLAQRVEWLRNFARCAGASREESAALAKLAAKEVLDAFGGWLDDVSGNADSDADTDGDDDKADDDP